ncbi:phosphotransferase family protein [Nocardia australiensis]|uniref:phosphotransferase family protein n=1 Tax=Nocardia australiensis TaxID=2887191 RepID=UPI001D152106|nr:phosphotransferase family protein [Nocardia australiensis]
MSDTREIVGIDPAAVTRWFTALGIEYATPLRFDRIGLGQSNLTYLVCDEAGRRWVLRRPPLGQLLASAHDVVREARIMSALESTDVPAPRILGVLDDPAVAEAPLVLMEYVDGQVVDTMTIAESLTPHRRRAIAESLPHTLAKIHAVDLAAVGLSDLASHKPYAQRQIKRWSGQWEKSKTRELPELDELTGRLTAAMPQQREVTLVHGDFHLRNVITSHATGAVTAALDWELSTLGDPLADMGSLLAYWVEPGENTGGDFPASTLDGFPNRAEMARIYLDRTGRDPAALRYWHSLGLWKFAIIAEGVVRRAIDTPQNKAAAGTPTIERIDAVISKALEIADSAGF